MSSEQLLVLLLLAAAFAAGWIARGGREDDEEAPGADAPSDDPLVGEADGVQARAVTAARAARAVVNGPAGSSEAATAASLRVLDQRMVELEEMADRLEASRGEEDPLFLAFDRVVSGMATLRRRIDADGAMAVIDAAQADWERARG